MFIFKITFKAIAGDKKAQAQANAYREYDDLGLVIDANNCRVVAATWQDAFAWAEAHKKNRDIQTITITGGVELAPMLGVAKIA